MYSAEQYKRVVAGYGIEQANHLQATGRATGKTTRAMLKAALRLSKGEGLVIIRNNHLSGEVQHFVTRLRDLVNFLGYLETSSGGYAFTTVSGGRLLVVNDCVGLRPNLHVIDSL